MLFLLDIYNYLENVIKECQTIINNSLIETYIKKIKFLNTSKSKPRYYLELLTFSTVKVLRSKKRNVYKNIKTVKMYHLYGLLKHY